MSCRDEWRRYVGAETSYLSAVEDLLLASYGPIMRAALQGQRKDGPTSFRAAIGLLQLLPEKWIEENLDVLLYLALEGGPEWFALQAEFDRVDSERLKDALVLVADEIILSQDADVNEYRALLRLIDERGIRDLSVRVIARAAESSNEEVRELADGQS
jgi:hypothetical protein